MVRKIEAKSIPIKSRGLAGDLKRLKLPTDSFVIENKGLKRAVLYSTASRLGIRIVTRLEDEGLRVWRRFADEEEPLNTQLNVEVIRGMVGNKEFDVLDRLRDLQAAAILRTSSIHDVPEAEVVEEDWVFTEDAVEHNDNGRKYRQQVLLPDRKRQRTVEVDGDNYEEIVRVMK